MKRFLTLLPYPLFLAGCMTAGEESRIADASVRAELRDAGGVARGSAILSDMAGGLAVRVSVQGLPPGIHGIHLHAVGRCDAPEFQTAGSHWNPAMKQHGQENPQGTHSGDLPNITIGADGRGRLNYSVPSATIAALLDADGAALLIHAAADDYRTDPSGNSGARIVCGAIERI